LALIGVTAPLALWKANEANQLARRAGTKTPVTALVAQILAWITIAFVVLIGALVAILVAAWP
jgi:hypothetical protein